MIQPGPVAASQCQVYGLEQGLTVGSFVLHIEVKDDMGNIIMNDPQVGRQRQGTAAAHVIICCQCKQSRMNESFLYAQCVWLRLKATNLPFPHEQSSDCTLALQSANESTDWDGSAHACLHAYISIILIAYPYAQP